MDDVRRQPGAGLDHDAATRLSGDAAVPPLNEPVEDGAGEVPADEPFEETLVEEIGALIGDGQTYAEAEFAFQKTRAKFAGKLIGLSAALLIVAIVLFHIAMLALAVGLVIALTPLVTIWGAILIVVGGLLLLVVVLALMAKSRASKVSVLFSSSKDGDSE